MPFPPKSNEARDSLKNYSQFKRDSGGSEGSKGTRVIAVKVISFSWQSWRERFNILKTSPLNLYLHLSVSNQTYIQPT
jgi:hypothetical protein